MDSRFPDFLKKQWVILADTVSSFLKNNDLTAASSLAFSATLALIPALFLLTSLLGIVIGSSREAFSETQEIVTEIIPTYSRAILDEVRFISTHKSAISALNGVILLWSITPLVSGMRLALGTIFKMRPTRPFLLEKLLDVSLTVIFLIGFSVIAITGVAFTLVERFRSLVVLPRYLGWIVPFLFVTAAAFVLYFTFSRRVHARHLLAGALVASVLWFIMRPAFILFLTYNPGYGFTFGSFKSLFVVIIWIYYSLAVLLFGAEITASLNRKEAVFVKRLMEGKGIIPSVLVDKFIVRYEKGSVIFREADESSEMYGVLKGSVGIMKGDKEIAVIGRGKYFGEMSFLLSQPRSATAVAREDTELIAISDRTIGTLMNEYPEFIIEMLREMATRLRETNKLVV